MPWGDHTSINAPTASPIWARSQHHGTYSISGTITLGGTGVEHARIVVYDQITRRAVGSAITDVDGNYTIPNCGGTRGVYLSVDLVTLTASVVSTPPFSLDQNQVQDIEIGGLIVFTNAAPGTSPVAGVPCIAGTVTLPSGWGGDPPKLVLYFAEPDASRGGELIPGARLAEAVPDGSDNYIFQSTEAAGSALNALLAARQFFVAASLADDQEQFLQGPITPDML